MRASAAWNWLLQRGGSLEVPADITRALDVAAPPDGSAGPEFVELHFSRLVNGYLNLVSNKGSAAFVSQGHQARARIWRRR